MAWKKKDKFLDGSSDDDSTSATSNKKRKKETVKRWGSVEDRRFNELVTDGTINISKKQATLHEIDKIGAKYFAGRSVRSFRDHYRGITAKLRLERKLAGGRRRIAGKTVQSYCFFGGEILTSSSLLSHLARTEGLDPEDTTDDDTDTDDDITSSDIMPPTNLKKRPTAAAAMTSTSKKKKAVDAPLLLFSPLQIASFKQVSYFRDGGDWLEVTVYTSGCVGPNDYAFGLAKDGDTLSFRQVLPSAFFSKTPPDYQVMDENNDSRSAEYASVAKSLRSTLQHDSSTSFFAEPSQVIRLEKRCEQVVTTKAYALPTEHTIEGSRQYMMAFWCKLKVMEEQQQKKKNGGIIVAASLDDDSSEEEDDDDNSVSSSDDDSNVPSNGRGGSRGGGGGGGGKKRKSGGCGGVGKKKGGGERKSSCSRKHNNIKEEASRKSEPGTCVGGIVSLLSQPSD